MTHIPDQEGISSQDLERSQCAKFTGAIPLASKLSLNSCINSKDTDAQTPLIQDRNPTIGEPPDPSHSVELLSLFSAGGAYLKDGIR